MVDEMINSVDMCLNMFGIILIGKNILFPAIQSEQYSGYGVTVLIDLLKTIG
jgi:hypothetical protein